MVYVIEYLARALKEAREKKKLSQRALGKVTGMPQARISMIENAAVDLQASTLIEMARALDLEVMLVPRKHVPAVKSLTSLSAKSDIDAAPPRPAYALDDEDNDG